MQFSTAGVVLVRAMEGCRLIAYRDQGGVWTIGWGHTGPEVVAGLVWTQAQADAAWLADVEIRSAAVTKLVHSQLGDNEFSAFCVFAFNIGLNAFAESSALDLANDGKFDQVPAHMRLWNEAAVNGVKKLDAELAGRREAEIALWLLPDNRPVPDFNQIRAVGAAAFRTLHPEAI